MKVIKQMLYDVVPVVFGVLIALLIGNLKESADDQRFLNKIFTTIDQEIESNLESMNIVLPGHNAFVDSIDYYLERDVPIAKLLETNFQTSQIQNVSWHSFLNSKLELVDFEVIAILSALDDNKETMNLKMEKLMDFVYFNLYSTKKEDKIALKFLVNNLIDTEIQSIKIQKEYREWYKKEIGQ